VYSPVSVVVRDYQLKISKYLLPIYILKWSLPSGVFYYNSDQSLKTTGVLFKAGGEILFFSSPRSDQNFITTLVRILDAHFPATALCESVNTFMVSYHITTEP